MTLLLLFVTGLSSPVSSPLALLSHCRHITSNVCFLQHEDSNCFFSSYFYIIRSKSQIPKRRLQRLLVALSRTLHSKFAQVSCTDGCRNVTSVRYMLLYIKQILIINTMLCRHCAIISIDPLGSNNLTHTDGHDIKRGHVPSQISQQV